MMVRLFPSFVVLWIAFANGWSCFPHDMRTYEKSRFRGGASKSSQSIREWGNPRRTSESLVLTHYTIPDGSFSLYSTLCILSSGFVGFYLLLLLFIPCFVEKAVAALTFGSTTSWRPKLARWWIKKIIFLRWSAALLIEIANFLHW